ncbi:MAG: hypothetical protein ABSA93_35415 [Streptosporangiaceae bacterium]|jgi:hypothetical protein
MRNRHRLANHEHLPDGFPIEHVESQYLVDWDRFTDADNVLGIAVAIDLLIVRQHPHLIPFRLGLCLHCRYSDHYGQADRR